MKSKEKVIKLIFVILLHLVFWCAFSLESTVFATVASGTVRDENESPIKDMEINYGGANVITSDSGYYTVNGTGNQIVYKFKTEGEYIEAKAESIIYRLKPEKQSKKYNIVIVRPESDYEKEYQEVENIFSNCDVEKKKVITYGDSGFNDGVSDPFDEYVKLCGGNYNSNGYVNLFIVIGKDNIPQIKIQQGQGNLSKGNIFYNTHPATKVPKYTQASSLFEQIKEYIFDFGGIEEIKEELPITIELSQLNVALTNPSENQIVNVKLTRKVEETMAGDFITGGIYLQTKQDDGSITRELISAGEYGKTLNNITAELINIDTGEPKGQVKVIGQGKYGFVKPEPGNYIVRFKYNGQEFKAIDEVSDNIELEIDGAENKENHAKEIEREAFNNKFKPINNTVAKDISKWEESLISIWAKSEVFEVKEDIPPSEDDPVGYVDPQKCINLVIEKRPEFEISLTKKIDIVKVTLADGKIYEEKNSADYNQVSIRQVIMDEEIMHGATIEIEYAIKVETNMEESEIVLLDYLDYNNNRMEYNPNTKLLSSGIRNSDIGWEVKNKTELEVEHKDGLKDDAQYLLNELQKDEFNYNSDTGKYEAEVRMVVTKLISSTLENEELLYQNSVEVMKYSNIEGRRLVWEDRPIDTDKNVPGNFIPDFDETKREELNTGDTSIPEDVFIIPPFGRENNVFSKIEKYIEEISKFLYRRDK